MIPNNYECEGQIDLFDILLPEQKYPPVINELSEELNSIMNLFHIDFKEEYSIWGHVPKYGWRYSTFISVNEEQHNYIIGSLEKMEEKYRKQGLEISVMQTPCIEKEGNVSLFISTVWKEKIRAKNG